MSQVVCLRVKVCARLCATELRSFTYSDLAHSVIVHSACISQSADRSLFVGHYCYCSLGLRGDSWISVCDDD